MMRWANRAAAAMSVSGQTSTNSSPPSRATTSTGRATVLRRVATSPSTRSPAKWPWASLIRLNWSRSRKSTATGDRSTAALESSRESRSTRKARLGSPVRPSCMNARTSSVSSSRRSLMLRATTVAPVSTPAHVVDRADGERDVDQPPVPGASYGLERAHGLAAPQHRHDRGVLVHPGRLQHADVLAHDLLGRVAVELLGAAVPRRDHAVRVVAEDRVGRRVDDRREQPGGLLGPLQVAGEPDLADRAQHRPVGVGHGELGPDEDLVGEPSSGVVGEVVVVGEREHRRAAGQATELVPGVLAVRPREVEAHDDAVERAGGQHVEGRAEAGRAQQCQRAGRLVEQCGQRADLPEIGVHEQHGRRCGGRRLNGAVQQFPSTLPSVGPQSARFRWGAWGFRGVGPRLPRWGEGPRRRA